MMRRAVFALLCAFFLHAGIASAADVADEADLQFQLGADRYEAGDFKGALEHFLASNRLVPNKNVVFNIARAYEQLRQFPDAYRYYVQALEGETKADARKRIEDAAARLRPFIALLAVETEPKGATIYLDRRDLGARGTTPRTLGLPAGQHKVIVELAGYEPQEVEAVPLQIGHEAKVTLTLVQILGTVRVEGPSGATVRVDREEAPVQCTIPCMTQVPPGKHILFVAREGFKAIEIPIEVTANATTEVRTRLEAQSGTVVVNSDVRDAVISVDGETRGFTPSVITVPVGAHKVRVVQSGFRPVERAVQVVQGGQVQLDIEFAGQEEVVAASRAAESVEDAPASVSIITREELRAFGYPTIADAIRGVRGIYLSYDDVYQSPGVRGFSRPGDYGNRILVTVDGQPTNDNYVWSSYVGFDGRTDLDDIERIEIVRGAGSVVYGTGAFFGVINLVTRSRSAPTHGELAVSTAHGVGRGRMTGVYKLNENAGGWLSVAGGISGGSDRYYPEYVSTPSSPILAARGNPSDGVARDADGARMGTIGGRVWWNALTVQWLLTSQYKYAPAAQYGTTFGDTRTHNADTRAFIEGRFEPKITDKLASLTRAHVNWYRFDTFLPYATQAEDPTSFGPERQTYRGTWAGLEQRFTYDATDKVRVSLGGEWTRHLRAFQFGEDDRNTATYVGADGGPIINRDDRYGVYAAYLTGDAQLAPRLKISAGARIDYFEKLDFDPLSSLSPRLALIAKPYAAGNMKLMFGKAFRAPSVYERFFVSQSQIAPSSGLKPEQVLSGELEFSHRFAPTVVATVAGFINRVTNLIELDTTSVSGVSYDQYRNSNAPVLVVGGEAEIRREWRQGWMIAATTTVQKASYQDDPNLREVPNSPVVLASFKGAMPIIGRSLMAATRVTFDGIRHDGRSKNLDVACDPAGGTPQPCASQGTSDPGVIWDLMFSGELERWGARYSVGVYNAMDWKYDHVPSSEFLQRTIRQPGRSFLASVGASF